MAGLAPSSETESGTFLWWEAGSRSPLGWCWLSLVDLDFHLAWHNFSFHLIHGSKAFLSSTFKICLKIFQRPWVIFTWAEQKNHSVTPESPSPLVCSGEKKNTPSPILIFKWIKRILQQRLRRVKCWRRERGREGHRWLRHENAGFYSLS